MSLMVESRDSADRVMLDMTEHLSLKGREIQGERDEVVQMHGYPMLLTVPSFC